MAYLRRQPVQPIGASSNGYDTAQHIGREICKLGRFKLFFDGSSKEGIPAVSRFIWDGVDAGYSLFNLSDRLRVRGWQKAAYTMPPNIQDTVVMRVLVRHGFSRDMAGMLLIDVKRGIDHLLAHRPVSPPTAAEATTFTHSAVAAVSTLGKLPIGRLVERSVREKTLQGT